MSKHVIKFNHFDGMKLIKPILWCGRKAKVFDTEFLDVDHVALAVGGSVQPCKNCIKAIIKELEKEL